MSDSGSAQRSLSGILVSAHTLPSGDVRLVFDQVRADSETFPQNLRSLVFATRNDYPRNLFVEMQLTDSQFQEIGENLLAMLVPNIHEP